MTGINDRLRVGMDVGKKSSTTASSGSTYPVLLQRLILGGPSYGGTAVPPTGTRFCVIRGVGSGGGYDNSYVDGGGQGGIYCRSSFPMDDSQRISWQIGQFSSVGGPSSAQTFAYLDSGGSLTLKLLAAAGNANTNSFPGQVNPNGSIGDVVRPGFVGGTKKGGDSGSDASDVDTLNISGVGATPYMQAGYGGGAAVATTGTNTATYYAGGDGCMTIEFWSGDPR